MVHLHVHSKYSLLDSIIQIDDIADKLKSIGQDTIAITDHGNLYASVEVYSKLIEKNIKVINGCEVYICDDVEEKNKNSKYYHLILLCKNETGRLNLQKLVTESTKYKYFGKPRIDFEMLKKHNDGLICLSACMAGEISRAIMDEDIKLAETIAIKYKNLFNDDFYIEYQSHENEEQQKLNAKLIMLANKLNIKYVVTSDAHYLNKEDQRYHNIFVQIGSAREAGEIYDDCYIQSEEDVINKCWMTSQYNNIAISNTHIIADKCENTIPLSAPNIPHVDIPCEFKSELDYLKFLCNQGFIKKGFFKWNLEQWKNYLSETFNENGEMVKKQILHFNSVKEIKKVYIDRANYEMDAISQMGFEGYYLLVHSYVTSVRKRGIARGSGGGSLLAYLCGIVDIDPIKYGLYFERFIDVGAIDLLNNGVITKKELKIPDFDVDFAPSERSIAVDFVVNKYGQKNVVALGQFSYIWAKSAIKDIGKVLNIPFEITNKITKNLNGESIEEALSYGLLDDYKDEYPELFNYASKLSGLPKSFGVHPCFPKDTLICTERGYINIQDVKVGDKVLTHNSNYKLVVNTMINQSDTLIKINSDGTLPICATLNHPFYIKKRLNKRNKIYSTPIWTEARNISKSDLVCMPINNKSIIPRYKCLPLNTKNIWWIIGRYLGDGWCQYVETRNDKRLIICCNKNNTDELNEICSKLNGLFDYRYIEENTTYKIYIKSVELYEYLQRFEKYAHKKSLHSDVINLPVVLLQSLIDGYLSADGYLSKEGVYSFKTVSKTLIIGMMQCIAKVYHKHCGVHVLPAKQEYIQGRLVNSEEKYCISFSKEKRQREHSFYEDGCLWFPVKSTNIINQSCDVYNLSVVDDNSYTVNNIAVHNCGKCLTINPAMFYNALEYNESVGEWVLQGDQKTAEQLGLVKADFLGLRTLDVFYDVLDMIHKDYEYIAPHKINTNDEKVWNEFSLGNTDCVFQFESSGMKQMLKEMKCDRIENLSAANALYRPGSLDYIPEYISRKNGLSEITYLNDDLIPILSNSYGIIVFQEQLIEIGRLAGLKNPDELRAATAKKKIKLMNKIEPELKSGLIKRGWTQESVDQLWEDIVKFAKYSFNKSHSSAYALTAYIAMFLKVHHTAEFFTAYINSYNGDIEGITKTINEAKRMGVNFEFDYWRNISGKCICKNNTVFLGVNTIRGFGENVAKALSQIGKKEINTFLDLINEISNNPNIDKSQFESLIFHGFFNEFGNPAKLLRIYQLYNDIYNRSQFDKNNLPIDENIIRMFAKETPKQYRNIENKKMFEYLCENIGEYNFSVKQILNKQLKDFGYINYKDLTKQNIVMALDVNTKYSPKIKIYSVSKGITSDIKISSKIFNNSKINIGDVFIIKKYKNEPKKIKTEHGFESVPNTRECWVKDYSIINI